MTSSRLRIALPLAAAVALGSPAAAHAAKTICVNAPNCPAGAIDGKGNLSGALTTAKSLPGPDTVLVGDKGSPYTGPFLYDPGADPANTVDIKADGPGRPVLANPGDQTGVVLTTRGGLVDGVEVRVPKSEGTGVDVTDGSVGAILVTGGGPDGELGIVTHGSATLARTTIDMSASNGILALGSLVADRLTVRGRVVQGIRYAGPATATVLNSRIEAIGDAIVHVGNAIVVRQSVLTTNSSDRFGFVGIGGATTLEHVTIAQVVPPRPGDSEGAGVTLSPNGPSVVTLRSIVIAGYAREIVSSKQLGRLADVSISDSVWDNSRDTIAGPFAEARNVHVDPRLVGPASGDVRLLEGSPAIDRDGQTAPAQYLDADLQPAVDGDGDGTARPDAGALEFRPAAPPVDPPAPPPGPLTPAPTDPGGGGAPGPVAPPVRDRTAPQLRAAIKRQLTLSLSVSEAAKVRVSAGKKTVVVRSVPAGKSRVALAKALKRLRATKKGRLTLVVTATDKAGNRSAARKLKLKLRR